MKVNIPRLIKSKEYCETVFKHFLRTRVLRKTDPGLFGKHLNKALNNLEFANFILAEHEHSIQEKLPKKSFYDWCITIYYYAIYHTALALVAKIGYDSKSHVATITAITLFYYHKGNVLKKEDIEFIVEKVRLGKQEIDLVVESKALRERACYGADESFELSQARRLQEQTADFVTRIRSLLGE